jgi:hypothetical protein
VPCNVIFIQNSIHIQTRGTCSVSIFPSVLLYIMKHKNHFRLVLNIKLFEEDTNSYAKYIRQITICSINTITFVKYIGDCFKYGYIAVHAHCVRLSDYGHLQMFQIYRMTKQFTAMCLTETISCKHRPSQK